MLLEGRGGVVGKDVLVGRVGRVIVIFGERVVGVVIGYDLVVFYFVKSVLVFVGSRVGGVFRDIDLEIELVVGYVVINS